MSSRLPVSSPPSGGAVIVPDGPLPGATAVDSASGGALRTGAASIAVVVPTWQEANALPLLLESLRCQSCPPQLVLVADAGSTDDSCHIAAQYGAVVVRCPQRGRGCQIAYALRYCPAEVVVIAHADMVFPPRALERLQQWLQEHPHGVGGCFGHRFASDRWFYRLIEWADRRRARRGMSYGDQAQFFRRAVLEQWGGFPAWPLFEDVALTQRLQQAGPLAYLDVPVLVSTRRFQRLGLLRTLWRNWKLRRRWARHGPAVVDELYKEYYGPHLSSG
ncbi:MAG: glycosyltransferase family 2 protein [Gemmataceae bacterium]|nr:glycosyltransferase family 2 protein [Gemmataceae bacterium]MCS7271733.1 glycosyltransferase family 2 protein [Gemmataceae bacterium]MDW8242401.1 glycosyltransferase family 2 protein [Thermogemmata sp.]